MTLTQCDIGKLNKNANGIVILEITCLGKEINKTQMIEAVKAIDFIAEKPSPLFVDASLPHSISFDALIEMAKATNVVAVSIYTPSETSKNVAKFIEYFQYRIGKAPYPFKIFSDPAIAQEWLNTFA